MQIIEGDVQALSARASQISRVAEELRSYDATILSIYRNSDVAGDNAAVDAVKSRLIDIKVKLDQMANDLERCSQIVGNLVRELRNIEQAAQEKYRSYGSPTSGTVQWYKYETFAQPWTEHGAAKKARSDAASQIYEISSSFTYAAPNYLRDAFDAQLIESVDDLGAAFKSDWEGLAALASGRSSIDLGKMIAHPGQTWDAMINKDLYEKDKPAWLAYVGVNVFTLLIPGIGGGKLAATGSEAAARVSAKLGTAAVTSSEQSWSRIAFGMGKASVSQSAIDAGRTTSGALRLADRNAVDLSGGSLDLHDAAGGHALSSHFGQTVGQLKERAIAEGKSQISTFTDRSVMETVSAQAIAANPAAVATALREGYAKITQPFESQIGIIYSRETDSVIIGKTVFIKLVRDATMPDGYRIQTEFVRQ